MELEALERRINRFQRKFNILCNCLQIKFDDDVTFPRSLSSKSDMTETEAYCKNEFEATNIEQATMPFSFIPGQEFRETEAEIWNVSELGAVTRSNRGTHCIPRETKFKLTPCSINLERLRLKEDNADPLGDSPAEESEQDNIACGDDGNSLDNFEHDMNTNSFQADFEDTVTPENEFGSTAPRLADSEDSQSQSQSDAESYVKNVHENPSRFSVRCPFCAYSFVRHCIYPHIRTFHHEKATKELLRAIRESLKTGNKITLPLEQTETFPKAGTGTARSKYVVIGGVKKYPCPGCTRIFQIYANYQSHIKNLHPEIYEEKIESGEFNPRDIRQRNLGSEAEVVKCPLCTRGVMQMNLESHIQNAHGHKESLLCSQCGYETKIKRNMLSHMERHSDEKKYKCDQCPFAAKQRQGLKLHVYRAHNAAEMMQQCFLCGELYKGLTNLKKHISHVHNNERRYPCPLCDKAFKAAYQLKYHVKTHDNPNGRKRGLNKERPPKRRRESLKPSTSVSVDPLSLEVTTVNTKTSQTND